MATAEATMADAAAHRLDRRANGSPPPAQSKRDKRRQMLNERLNSLAEKLSKDRDQVYREKLHKIQIDTTLVMRVDPYADRPLDGFEQDLQRLQQLNGDTDAQSGPQTLLDRAGPRFSKWMEKVQDLAEQRDYALTKYKFDYEKKTSEYMATHAFKVETANREYRALAQTLRDRLINVIMSKKNRLNKEKEALEISDASALLLHPNQFSITNPSSPGGAHGKRATRQRRELEDVAFENKKRKRNNNNNDDDGSPAPQRRALDGSATTPLWQADRLASRKTAGAVYSIDKLFTDKELSMTSTAATLAARRYILTHKPKLDEHGHPIRSPGGSDSGAGDNDENDGSDSVPSAPTMERNVSHATRSGRGGANNPNFLDDKLLGVEMLANFDFAGNFDRMLAADPKLPPTFPSTYIKGNKLEYNVPSTLSAEEAQGDIMVMQALRQYDEAHGVGSNFSIDNGSRKLLEAASMPAQDRRFVAYLQGERPSENQVRKQLGLPLLSDVVEPVMAERAGTPKPAQGGTPGPSPSKGSALGGVPMSRQSSANGVPMSRSSSRKGGRGGRGG
ncbi:6da68d2a-9cce-4762-b484-43a7aed9a9dc [Thermothielavioides terrestris]|uniref:6da68d2a-9cce-4762-b484-43a7aed9a9dc n=1 Tax=Thermothielavioides terrestris TaxID=2587410 RepID=A0A3S4DAU1_9PEZI|nr:6da68d2a-9cce-4762-b484-43a7aed9a9dc [Thermothielavioides terrestris]